MADLFIPKPGEKVRRKQAQALKELDRPAKARHPAAWPADCDSEELYVS